MDEIDREMSRIENAFQGVFERIERASEDERSYILHLLNSRWCSCGKALEVCAEPNDTCGCGAEGVVVTAIMCPECEWIIWPTVKRVD